MRAAVGALAGDPGRRRRAARGFDEGRERVDRERRLVYLLLVPVEGDGRVVVVL